VTVQPRRSSLVAAYALLAAAGVAAVLWPSPAIEAAGGTGWAKFWGLLLIAGGLAAATGTVLDHWLGEWCGLPALVAVWAVYGASAMVLLYRNGDMPRLPGALALLAVSALLLWRWSAVNAERDAARAVRQHRNGDNER
jgi:hypothetical protein